MSSNVGIQTVVLVSEIVETVDSGCCDIEKSGLTVKMVGINLSWISICAGF